MTQPLPWEKNAAVPVPPAPEPVPLDAYTAPAAPEPELVPLDIYDAPAPAPKPAKPLVDIDSLNPAQREAVLTTEGPLLVLAGAGSGKTRVLTFRIAHMLGDLGVKPWQILAITFTNKAAAEMRERLAALIPSGTRGMWVCTFHAMCVRMLREDADLLGYTGQFTIYDDDDSKRMVRDIMQALGIEQKQFPINMIRSKISSAKNAMIGPEDMLKSADSPNDKKAAQVYLELERRLRAANAMDFDDLLVRTLELLRTRPEVLDKYQERFRYISVDEYQDTNHVQYEIANLLAAKYQNLMVVGDDDQSIYSWRGADITNILDFEKDFKNCKTVKLEQNYRSTGHILSAANAVVRHNSQRKDKRLFTAEGDGEKIQAFQASDERDEGRWIAGEIEKLHSKGTSYDDIAVFYRTNAQSRILEDMFLRAGVPYKIVGGTRFFDRAEIRDVMAYLKMIVNPADEMSVKRVINTPRRGIGSTSIQKIEQLARDNRCSFFQACEIATAETGMFSAKVRNGLSSFVSLVREGRRMDGELKDVVEMIVDKTGLLQAFRAEGTMESESRAENIQEFLGVAAEFEETHEDIEGTLESLEELRAAGVADVPADVEPEPVVVSAPAPEPGPSASASSFEALVGARDAAGSNPLDSLAAPALSPQDALAAAIAGNAYAAPTEMPAGAVHADEIERTYGPLTCKALSALMEWLALRSDLDSLAGETHAITMMTIHSAKGLEFPAVFVAGMEEGIFPHVHDFGGSDDPGKLEEERRLAYVAITRARKRLFLTYAATRRTYGSTSANPRSRFLNEIPFEDIEFSGIGSAGFEGTGWEKRGDRRGTFGSGMGSDMYGGKVFGSHTRSTGGSGSRGGSSFDDFFGGSTYGTERHRGVSPDAGRVASTFGSGAPRAKKPSSKVSPTVERKVDRASASQDFSAGDTVSHKTFGTGTVLSVVGDMIEVQFEKTGQTKKLMKGFAPIVKLNA
ncbi:ATP-dependent helicase [Collinsella aerofaciens]|uniref:ATP-dependent helicase n=1 Tax=Collinsella aerofaciens TaxID=74426 RepID=UPI00232E5CBD|nr:UvrD-helicase domain-containing protein [Collinsella aerofaciens]MDB1879898.1 UvrD-helicase domain-containing protein [Collinsella aerofaciens]MDB1881835.1 UvrD-helicase domain-containing protein [Collinsella aerofaciens]MDB1883946.1 UvrD-helicase domain-containing protein [Collinsella aerofaciens]MDB1887741.1 UvrD-helicase domain-containing protein [Collinsella aerofaciens]